MKATKSKSIRIKLNGIRKKKVPASDDRRNLRGNMSALSSNANSNREIDLDQQEQPYDAENVGQNNAESLQQTAKKLLQQTNSLIGQLLKFRKCLNDTVSGVSNSTVNANLSVQLGSDSNSPSNDSFTDTTASNYMSQHEVNHLNRVVLNITETSEEIVPLLNSHDGKMLLNALI